MLPTVHTCLIPSLRQSLAQVSVGACISLQPSKIKSRDFPSGPVVGNPPTRVWGESDLIPGPGRFHMPHGKLGPCAATSETRAPKARAPQQEKPLHRN